MANELADVGYAKISNDAKRLVQECATEFICFIMSEANSQAREAGRTVVAVEDVGKHAPWQVDLRGPVLIIVGGEEAGISEALRSQADAIVRVPMHGFLPSYNLQAAMAIVMGERLRQAEDGQ